jgi:hypothetical protein
MGSVPVYGLCALLVFAPAPAFGAGPLALLGKHILKEMVKDFFKSQLTSLARDSLGPCKSMLADSGVGAARGLAAGLSGGMAGMPGMPAVDPAMLGQMMQDMPQMQAPAMDPAMREQMMQVLQSMQSAAPLSGDEVDELVNRLVALSKAMPDQALPCSPQELKLVFGRSSSMPMAAGPLRMMLVQFREMDQRFKETQETFARMSPAEQDEAVEAMLAETGSMSAEERKQLAAFLQSELFGLPAPVREKFRARLAVSR